MKRGDITSWRRDGAVLVPASPRARALLQTLEEGARVPVQILHDRNLPQMRRYQAMLARVVAATGRWASVDDLSFEISIALKSGHAFQDKHGGLHWVPDSRAFTAMPQDKFDELVRNTEQWLCANIPCDLEDLHRDHA